MTRRTGRDARDKSRARFHYSLLKIGERAPFQYAVPEAERGKTLCYSNQPVSSTSGILRVLVGVDTLVRGRQSVAKVYNAFGRLQETLLAVSDGVVLGHSDSSVAFPGAPVMAFGLL